MACVRSLTARGSVGGVTGNVFEENEERFAHPSVCFHHERDEILVHCVRCVLILTVLLSIALCNGVAGRRRSALAGFGLALWNSHRIVCCVVTLKLRDHAENCAET